MSSIFLHSSYVSGLSKVSFTSSESFGDSTLSVNVSYAVSEKVKSEVSQEFEYAGFAFVDGKHFGPLKNDNVTRISLNRVFPQISNPKWSGVVKAFVHYASIFSSIFSEAKALSIIRAF